MHKFLKLMEEGGEGGGGGAAATATAGAAATVNFWDSFKDPEIKESLPKMFPSIKDPEALAKTAVHQQRLLGQKGVQLPQKPEEVLPWLQTNFKVPKEGKEYKFDKVKIPDAIKDKDAAKAALPVFADVFAKAGLTQEQTEVVTNAYYELAGKEAEQSVSSREQQKLESTKALEKEWGSDFKKKVASAEMALSTLGGPKVVEAVLALGLNNNAEFVKMLANAAELMKEDPATGKLSSGGFAAGAEQAEQEIEMLYGDKAFMDKYTNANDPGHTQARQRMERLFKIKHGELGRQPALR